MANGKVLRQLIKAGVAGDVGSFRQVSEKIISDERQKQHHLLANDLESILYSDHLPIEKSKVKKKLPPVPVDKEREFPLLEIKAPQKSIEEMILCDKSYSIIEDVLEEQRRQDILKSYGLKPSSKVIFFGPPGCGKTLAAEVIAYELDLPLAVVRLDAIVSSFLGETAANLRKVFDFISSSPLVVLFDEFDAIGKERDDYSEHGELRRVVNAVLQMIDSYQGKSVVLAATNHEKILDSAIWRRFDETIEFPLPGRDELGRLVKLKLRGVRREFDVDDKEVIELFEGVSGANIERVVRRAVKKMVLRGQEFLTVKDLECASRREILNT